MKPSTCKRDFQVWADFFIGRNGKRNSQHDEQSSLSKFTDQGYKPVLHTNCFGADRYPNNMRCKRNFLSRGDNGEPFNLRGSFKETQFTNGLQYFCTVSGIHGSPNWNVYSARLHRLSGREVYKQHIRVCSVFHKDCV